MAYPDFSLNEFIARFQLMRPQPAPAAHNRRQAAVLLPAARRSCANMRARWLFPAARLTQPTPR